MSSYRLYNAHLGTILMHTRWEFHRINCDAQLTEADKKQLKDFYLQNCVAPKARKLLEEHLAEEERKRRTQNASANQTHDRH